MRQKIGEKRSRTMKITTTFARWPLAIVTSLSLLAGCSDAASEPEHGRLGRLVVSDGELGRLTVIDLEHGDVLSTFDITSPAALHAGSGKRFAYAHQKSAGIVQIIDSGLHISSHGDHDHVDVEMPALLTFTLSGVAPVHFTHHDGQAVVFFDGAQASEGAQGVTAHAVIVPDISLAQGMPVSISIPLSAAQHGVAVPVGNGLIVTSDVPAATSPSNPLPNGVSVTDWDGNVLQVFDGSCAGLHGEAALTEHRIAFACADHILIVERLNESASFTTRELAYPDTRRSGTLDASLDGKYLFGNHKDETRNGIIRIDVTSNEVREVSFDAGVAEFAVLPGLADTLVVLTADGRLHVIDTTAFEIVHTFDAVEPFTVSHSAPHPGLAVADDLAFVSDSEGGAVLEYEIAHLERGRRFSVAGFPASLVVLGPASHVHDDHDE
jgi:hypothetical protein